MNYYSKSMGRLAKPCRQIETLTRTGLTAFGALQSAVLAYIVHKGIVGWPEVLKYEDAPRPKPEAGEVLVRVHAAGVNPVDWKSRAISKLGHQREFQWRYTDERLLRNRIHRQARS
ncbi:MAG: hypothetical protein ACREYE_07255 [Gammaproteobacteria bacterium]